MKKLTSFIIAGAILTSFTSCSSSGSSSTSAEPVTDERSGKQVLTIAYVGTKYEGDTATFNSFISEFNIRNKKYRLETIHYKNDEDSTAFTKLKSDLIDGKTPDLIAAEPYQIRILDKRGYLEDFGKLMDEYDYLKREDFVPSLLSAITVDEHIPGMPEFFYAETACVETELLGEDITNWNFEQAISFYNSLTEDDQLRFTDYITNKDIISRYFIEGAILSSMDFREEKFDPENGLRQALEFIYSLPDNSDKYINRSEVGNKMPIITFPTVSPSGSYSMEAVANHEGKPVSLVGYPTENGKGVSARPYSPTFSIMNNSDFKEEAWEIVSSFLVSDSDLTVVGDTALPMIESVYPTLYDRDPDYQWSINTKFVDLYGGLSLDGEFKYQINDEQKQQLKDYIADMDIFLYNDPEVEDIIREECDYVINGERTPDQCITILKDRISTYLAENE